jgi:hypothetical protein
MINKTFIAGMLAMALVFGMTGCDTGTNTVTKTEYVPTGGGVTGVTPVDSEDTLKIALGTGEPMTVRVVKSFALKKSLVVNPGQTIIVGGTPNGNEDLQLSKGGPLFGVYDVGVYLDIQKTLTLNPTSALIIAGGAVNVKAPTTGTNGGKLDVQSGALVSVGIDFSDNSAPPIVGTGTLRVEANADASFAPNSALIVTTASSSVVLENTNSGLQLAAASKLVVEGGSGTTPVIGKASDNSVIVLPDAVADNGSNTVGILDVDVYTSLDNAEQDFATGSNDNADTGTGSLGEKVAEKAEEVSKGEVDVSAKYPLSTVEGVNPKGLKIASAVKDLSTQIVTITLEGEAGVVIPYSASPNSVYYDMFDVQDLSEILIAAEAAKGYSAVVIAGLLDYEQAGKIKQINQAFNMSTKARFELINGTDKKHGTENVYREKPYAAEGYYPSAIGGFDMLLWNGATSKTITLEISQPADAPTPQKFLIDYTAVTFTPTATEAAAITLANALGGGLAAGSTSVYGPTVTLKEDVTLTADKSVTVPKDVTLVVPGSKTLDLSALFTGNATNDKPVALAGDLVVEKDGILNISQGNGNALPPEIDWANSTGNLIVKHSGKVTLEAGGSDVGYIGSTTGDIYQWTDTDNAATQNVTLNEADGITMNANITANAFPGGGTTNYIRGTKNTISKTFALTVGTTELKVGTGAALTVEGTISLDSGKVLSIDPNAKLTVTDTGTIAHVSPATKVKFKVYKHVTTPAFAWESSQATVVKTDTNWLVTQVSASPTADFEIILGKVKVTGTGVSTNVNIAVEDAATAKAEGSITTAAATIVTFEGET